MSMAVPLPAGICIITRALIGGSGSDYDSITRALISEGSKLRAKKWCCSSFYYCGCGVGVGGQRGAGEEVISGM